MKSFSSLSLACVLVAIPAQAFELLINCGSAVSYTEPDGGRVWQPDDYFVGGGIFRKFKEILGTDNDGIYHFERNAQSFSYAIPVPNGMYDVTIHLAEIFFTEVGKRIFDIDVEGQLMEDIDLVASPGAMVATTFTKTVSIADGVIDIALSASKNRAKISGIEIVSVGGTPSPTTSPVAATDPPTSSPTTSPVAATDSPTTSPTTSPVAATDSPTTSPTTSPVAATDSPTTSPTTSPVAGTPCDIVLTLYDADNDVPIEPLMSEVTFQTGQYSILAEPTAGCPTTGSALFRMTGADPNKKTENVVPYFSFGDKANGDILGRNYVLGDHTLEVKMFALPKKEGGLVVSKIVDFTVVAPTRKNLRA